MTYMVEATFTDAEGNVERWITSDLDGGTTPVVFASAEAARRMISKYRTWSKDWAGKRSFRVLEAGVK